MTKLDFLMNLTNTRNSILSKAVSFDPSYISRVRTGRRAMPRSRQFLEPLAVYFIRSIKTPQQMKLLTDAISPGEDVPEDREELTSLLISWLAQPSDAHYAMEKKLSQTEYFFGDSGKREAVELYLLRLCTYNQPQSLLIFTDESIHWLVDDQAFLDRWRILMQQLFLIGSRIRLVSSSHSFEDWNRILREREWFPFFEKNQIEIYDATKLPQGIHRRSLLVAVGNSALASCSIEGETEHMLSLYTSDKAAVAAMQLEFSNYIKRCPLLSF